MKAYKVLADTKNMSRDEWLEYRRMGIGGSDAASIVGLNPYSSPLAVYADKVGLAQEKPTTLAMRIGNELEGFVAQLFTEASGLKVRRENHILQSIEHPFMLANVDRMVIGEKTGLECKTTSSWNKSDWEGGAVPDTYYTQCQHYMAVTGYENWYLAVLVDKSAFYWYQVPRNEEDIAALIAAEGQFWTDCVEKLNPPDPIGRDCDADVIRILSRTPDGSKEVMLSGVDSELDRLAEIDAMRKALEREGDAIKQSIQLRMGDATIATTPRYTIRWPEVSSTRLDTKRLKAEEPDVYAKYGKPSTSRRFTYKEAQAS